MTSRIASAESDAEGRAVDSDAGTRLRGIRGGIRSWIRRRSRRPRVLAVLAAYLVAAAAPCPTPAVRGAEATARSGAPDAAHAAHHGHGATAHAAGPTAPSGTDVAPEAGCERPVPLWTGHCRCGCGKRQTPLVASSLGFVLLLAERTAPPRLDAELAPHSGTPHLPAAPAGAIDHVPLPA
jgi:hypothetical protein